MRKIIYLICSLVVTNSIFSQINSPNGDNIFYYDGAADVIFKYPLRGAGGRAFVHYPNNILNINYQEDFTGGTLIGNSVFFKDNGNSYISSGNFGVGTTNPSHKIEVAGSGFFHGAMSSSISDDGGGKIELMNPSKSINGAASRWTIYNMTGVYGNSLQFWAYDYLGCGGGMCTNRFTIMDNGNVGIGMMNPNNKLDVNGTIHSKEVKVDITGWSDFVLKKEYNLPTLEQVEKHIAEKGHLENIPSEKEVLENGINVGEMNARLLQKIEEMTLYIIDLKKENEKMKKENQTTLERQVDLERRINNIENK